MTPSTYVFELVSKRNNAHFTLPVTAYTEAEAFNQVTMRYADEFEVSAQPVEVTAPHKYYAELNCA